MSPLLPLCHVSFESLNLSHVEQAGSKYSLLPERMTISTLALILSSCQRSLLLISGRFHSLLASTDFLQVDIFCYFSIHKFLTSFVYFLIPSSVSVRMVVRLMRDAVPMTNTPIRAFAAS